MRRWLPFLLLLLATTAFARVPAPAALSPPMPTHHRLAQVEGRDPARYGYDDHATTRFPTAKHEATTDTYTYDAIENSIAPTPTPGSHRSTGDRSCDARYDPDLGLDHRRARHLNLHPGQLWTMDVYEGNSTDPLSLHKYLYCHANPVNGVDPSGHEFTLIGTLKVGAIGATVGALSTVVANHALGRAQTTSSILMGAGLGAVLGPLAVEYAWFGVAVGGVGVASSGAMVWEVFDNPNSTYFQKVEASALLVASVWGTTVGVKYARAARTTAAEQASTAPTTKRLFRVVTKQDGEVQQLLRTGEFEFIPGKSSTPDGLPGKWFYGTRAEAEAFAQVHAKEGPRLVATEITEANIAVIKPGIDGNKTGYFVPLEDLAGAKIDWIPWP